MGRLLVLLSGASCLVAACHRGESGRAHSSSPAVATVGDRAITVDELKARLAEQPPFALARYKTLEKKREFLDGLVRTELLLAEARRRKLDEDPEVRAAVEKVLIHRLTRVHAEEQEKAHPVSEGELRQHYDLHRSEFVAPTRVRVSHILLASPEKDPKRAARIAESQRILAQIKSRDSSEKQAFEKTAAQKSEDEATKATGGVLESKTRDELAAAYGPAFADAALALKEPGETVGPVVSSRGIHLIRLLTRHDGYETPFEAARSRIQSRLQTERRSRGLEDLVAALKGKTPISIDEKPLADVEVPATAATH